MPATRSSATPQLVRAVFKGDDEGEALLKAKADVNSVDVKTLTARGIDVARV